MSYLKETNFDILLKINSLINEHHNINISKLDSKIILLYNDGEIGETMGGDKFLQRSIFTKFNSLSNVNFKMPIVHGKYSFAVLPSIEIAQLIRNHMKLIN